MTFKIGDRVRYENLNLGILGPYQGVIEEILSAGLVVVRWKSNVRSREHVSALVLQ